MSPYNFLAIDLGAESGRASVGSLLLYLDEILLHVSRGVRRDSDHGVIFNDDLQANAVWDYSCLRQGVPVGLA